MVPATTSAFRWSDSTSRRLRRDGVGIKFGIPSLNLPYKEGSTEHSLLLRDSNRLKLKGKKAKKSVAVAHLSELLVYSIYEIEVPN